MVALQFDPLWMDSSLFAWFRPPRPKLGSRSKNAAWPCYASTTSSAISSLLKLMPILSTKSYISWGTLVLVCYSLQGWQTWWWWSSSANLTWKHFRSSASECLSNGIFSGTLSSTSPEILNSFFAIAKASSTLPLSTSIELEVAAGTVKRFGLVAQLLEDIPQFTVQAMSVYLCLQHGWALSAGVAGVPGRHFGNGSLQDHHKLPGSGVEVPSQPGRVGRSCRRRESPGEAISRLDACMSSQRPRTDGHFQSPFPVQLGSNPFSSFQVLWAPGWSDPWLPLRVDQLYLGHWLQPPSGFSMQRSAVAYVERPGPLCSSSSTFKLASMHLIAGRPLSA